MVSLAGVDLEMNMTFSTLTRVGLFALYFYLERLGDRRMSLSNNFPHFLPSRKVMIISNEDKRESPTALLMTSVHVHS